MTVVRSPSAPTEPSPSVLGSVSLRIRHAFVGVGLFSAIINLLALTGSLFMLQVYDRVLPSRSVPTLVALSVLTAALFTFYGMLDLLRGRVLVRVGASLDAAIRDDHLLARSGRPPVPPSSNLANALKPLSSGLPPRYRRTICADPRHATPRLPRALPRALSAHTSATRENRSSA